MMRDRPRTRTPLLGEEEDEGPPLRISGLELLTLSYCAVSSRLGMADKGSPAKLATLAAKGLVRETLGGGYKITPDGKALLDTHWWRLGRT
jgi:hypothetical protein